MSDHARKDFSDKAAEKVTPDSSKSTTEKIKESVTGTADHAARDVQPDSDKSTLQSASDKTNREKDHHEGESESTVDKIKHTLGVDKH